MSQESESASGNKQTDEKMKRLRKRNADLVSLAKQLDEKCKALMMENEKMVSSYGCDGRREQQLHESFVRVCKETPSYPLASFPGYRLFDWGGLGTTLVTHRVSSRNRCWVGGGEGGLPLDLGI